MNIEMFYAEFEERLSRETPERVIQFLSESLDQAEAEDDQNAAVSVLNEMAGYFRNLGLFEEAVREAERALFAMRELGYANTVHYGTALLNAATAYRCKGDNKKALELFTASLQIFTDNLPADDYRLAAVYNNVSAIYEDAEQYGVALHNLQMALDILEKNTGHDEEAAVVQTNIATLFFKMNLPEDAVRELENALRKFRSGPKKPGPQYASALSGVGEALVRMGKFEAAVNAYEEALEHIHSAFGKNRDYAISCMNCAIAYEGLGEDSMAAEYREFANSILQALGVES